MKQTFFIISMLAMPQFLYCSTEQSFLHQFIMGACAGTATAGVVEPIIYIKNRLQQGEKISWHLPTMYRGVFVNSFGFVPTMAIQNSVFGKTQNYLNNNNIDPLTSKILSGCAAGTASALISCPRELLTIKQQNSGGRFYDVAKSIVTTQGIKGLQRGFIPIALRNSSFAGFLFGFTPAATDKVKTYTDSAVAIALVPPIIAGSASALITHPFDTLRARMQGDAGKKSTLTVTQEIYTGANSVSKVKGLKAFYKGLTPRLCGVVITMTLEYHLRNYFTKQLNSKKKLI